MDGQASGQVAVVVERRMMDKPIIKHHDQSGTSVQVTSSPTDDREQEVGIDNQPVPKAEPEVKEERDELVGDSSSGSN